MKKPDHISSMPVLNHVWDKVHKDRENCLILTTGKVQKGKSSTNLELADRLDRPYFSCSPSEKFGFFSINQVAWMPEKFTDIISHMKLKRGSVIMFEEIGTESGGVNRRKWYDFNNFIVNDVLQTFGFEGLVVFFSVPTLNYVDKNTYRLMDIRIQAQGKDIRQKTNTFKAWQLDYNEDLDTLYRHNFYDDQGRKVPFYRIKRTVDKTILKQFYDAEEEYKKWIQEQGNKRLKEAHNKKEMFSEEEVSNILIEDFKGDQKYWKTWHSKRIVNKGLVQNKYNLGFTRYTRVRDMAYNKIDNDPKLDRSVD